VGLDKDEETALPHENDLFERALEATTQELPRRTLATYARLWQLETWLRQMVYVELRANFGNSWQQQVTSSATYQHGDSRLTHMPTPEQQPISYITFGALQKTITRHWSLFEKYLPPQNLWDAKLEEISQIRNRVAHFRLGHHDDLQRVLRFMKDVDKGFWTFCTSYNAASPVLPPSRDPVVKRFQSLDQFPYVKVDTRRWAMVGVADPDAIFSLSINVLRRPWHTIQSVGRIAGQAGFIYDIVITAREKRRFDYSRYLQDTKRVHGDLVHICLDSFNASIRVTIPAILGTRAINRTAQVLLDWIPNSLHRSEGTGDRTDETQDLAEEWPEYVLGPKNPLCFLTPDMPCSFFMT